MKKTTKTLVALMLVVAMILSFAPITSNAATTHFSVSSASAEIGQKATIELKTKEAVSLDNISIEIEYDASKVSITKADLVMTNEFKAFFNDTDPDLESPDMRGSNVHTEDGKEVGKATAYAVKGLDPVKVPAGTTILTLTYTVLDAGAGNNNIKFDIDSGDSANGVDYKGVLNSTITGTLPPVAVSGVTLDKTSGTLNEGETVTLTATVEPADATDKTVTWASSNNAVATVENGVVKAVAPGTAVITATAGNQSASYSLEVKAPLKGITLNHSEMTVIKGQSAPLTVSYNPTYTTDAKDVTWTSSNEDVATVENGVVRGVSKGTATITAKVGGFTAECTVTINEIPLKEIAIDTTDFEMEVESTKQLGVVYNPNDTTDDKKVVWSSDNEDVVTVDENGVVTAVAVGEATITADVNGKTATVKITVNEKKIDEPTEDDKKDDNTEVDVPTDEVGKVEENKPELPKTGDIAIGVVVALMLVSAAGIVFITKKNRK